MIKTKIDPKLLNEIDIQNLNKNICCFVEVYNMKLAKQQLVKRNIHILDEYLFIKTFFCEGDKKTLFDITDFDSIKFVASNVAATSLMYVAKKVLNVGASKLSGKGVGVAFIDTGISNHFDFCLGENRILGFRDFVNDMKEPYDDNGHGSFVAGVCSGSGAQSALKYSGIAPKSNIFSLKALNKNGESGANKILQSMEWVFDNHTHLGIRVVCMSFGSESLGMNDPIAIGANALWDEGVIVVAAAGNSGPDFQTIKSPGISKKIVTVGGIDDNRFDNNSFDKNFFEIANFSSRGPVMNLVKPDLVAPSVDIMSCDKNGGYKLLSGTSVATPMVAGILCLICEKYKNISPEEAKQVLIKSCKPLGFDKNCEGFGLPDFSKII